MVMVIGRGFLTEPFVEYTRAFPWYIPSQLAVNKIMQAVIAFIVVFIESFLFYRVF
jgi:hypothetical protein